MANISLVSTKGWRVCEGHIGDIPALHDLQIAVLKETGGRGPYSSLVMAIVIVKDVVVFVCFAVNIEVSDVVRSTVAMLFHIIRAGPGEGSIAAVKTLDLHLAYC